MDQLIKPLKQLGLEPTEIKVYLAALQIGSSAASIIAKRASIPRSTACYTLDGLVTKGLVTKVYRGNTQIYTCRNPERLDSLIQEEKDKLEQKSDSLHRIMGTLKQMQNPTMLIPKVRFYEGIEEIKNLYNKILEEATQIDSIEEKGELFSFFPEFTKKWISKRAKKQIPNRCIYPLTDISQKTNYNNPKLLRKTKGIDPKKYPFSCDVKIFGENVTIVSFTEISPVGIWIKNQDISAHFQTIFNLLWDKL